MIHQDPPSPDLSDCRVIGILSSIEAFGQEKANMEVFKSLRSMGAKVLVGVNAIENGGRVGDLVRDLDFDCFTLPFGCQWSKTFFRRQPSLILKNANDVMRCSRELKKQIKRLQATHLHMSNSLAYSYVYGALKTSRLPMIYRMGDEPPHDSRPNLMIWKSCFAHAQNVIANSHFVRESILKAVPSGSEKLRLIYNLAPGGRSSSSVIDQPDPFTGASIRLLYVGQLAQHKGIEDLLNAVVQLLEAKAPIKLDIVGRSSSFKEKYREKLDHIVMQSGYSSQITFHGHLADPTPRYAEADVLIVPSIFEEPAANVVLEAKKLGVPSVVYPSGGLPELVVHGENGFVCREKSVDALVEGLRWYIDRPHRIHESREAALADSQRRFGKQRFEQQWRDVYTEGAAAE